MEEETYNIDLKTIRDAYSKSIYLGLKTKVKAHVFAGVKDDILTVIIKSNGMTFKFEETDIDSKILCGSQSNKEYEKIYAIYRSYINKKFFY